MPAENYKQTFQLQLTILVFFILFNALLYVAIDSDSKNGSASHSAASQSQRYQKVAHQVEQNLRLSILKKRQQFSTALQNIETSGLPPRLRVLRERHEIVGERLNEIKAGKETVQEILLAASNKHLSSETSDKPPIELEEIQTYLSNWLYLLHETLSKHKRATFEGIWQA
jgi:hypothetical protein